MSAVPAYSRYGGYASASRRHRSANAYGDGNTAFDLYGSGSYDSAYAPRYSHHSSRPEVDVIRGTRPQVQTLSPVVPTILKAVAALLVVLTVMGILRITLNSATITTAVDVQETSSALASARTEGNKLEVSQSALSNPSHVKEAATALGMSTPAVTTYIDMNTGKSSQVVAPEDTDGEDDPAIVANEGDADTTSSEGDAGAAGSEGNAESNGSEDASLSDTAESDEWVDSGIDDLPALGDAA